MKNKISGLMLMLLMCWASQSSAQPTPTQQAIAKKEYAMGMCLGVNYHNLQDSAHKGYSRLSASYLGGLGYARHY